MLDFIKLPDADDTVSKNIVNSDDVEATMVKIIGITKSGNGLENLQTMSENIELLHTFGSYCLIHFITMINCGIMYVVLRF